MRPTAGVREVERTKVSPSVEGDADRGRCATGPAGFAFLAVVPVALVLILVGAIVAPGLIHEPRPGSSGLRFFTGIGLAPEPLEQARFFLFLVSAPAVMATSILLSRLLQNARPPGQFLLGCSLLVELLAAVAVVSWWRRQQTDFAYFPSALLLITAAAAVAAVCAAFWLHPAPARRTAWIDKRVAAAAAVFLAVAVTAIGLLPSLFHETNIGASLPQVHHHLTYTMDEFVAVANGRTPLVDFIPQYSNVLPYLVTPLLSIVGISVGTFIASMFILSLTALLSIFYVLAKVSGRWAAGLVLYVPFLALSLYRIVSSGDQHYYIANYFAVMPLRYFGPWLVAGLVVWQLRRPSHRRLVALFAIAGAFMINNPDFGLPSFTAAAAATWLAGGRAAMRSPAWAQRVLLRAAMGLGAAVVAVTVISLARSGQLPDFGLSLYFARQFALSGFYLLPMPSSGLHLAIGLTFAGALVRAVFRGASPLHQGERARLLTGSLAYGSVFGLGASSYYVGRSHPEVLAALFSAWAFVLALLARDAWDDIRCAPPRSTTRALWFLPSVLVASQLFLSVAPAWDMRDVGEQADRIAAGGMPALLRNDDMVAFVRRHAQADEKVLILGQLSHRTALRAGVRDVLPYNSVLSIVTQEQLDVVRERLRIDKVEKVFTGLPVPAEMRDLLTAEGFRPSGGSADLSQPVLWERPARVRGVPDRPASGA